MVESRRIFRKLKAYVTYRFAATIQIVTVLSMLIYISNCAVNPLFIILLALFNDLTMLPIAYDRQQASATPENPDVVRMLTMSASLGIMETIFSLIFAYGAKSSGIFSGDYTIDNCDKETQGAIWIQMFIAAELLIFVTRAPKLIIFSLAPSLPLFISVMMGCFTCSMLAGLSKTFGGLPFVDIVIIWSYDILCLSAMDVLKVGMLAFFDESTDVLPETVETGSISDKPKHGHGHGHSKDLEAGTQVDNMQDAEDFSRASMSANRLTEWAITHGASTDHGRQSSVGHTTRPTMTNLDQRIVRESFGGRMSMSHSVHISKSTDLRPSLISTDFHANTPGNRRKF